MCSGSSAPMPSTKQQKVLHPTSGRPVELVGPGAITGGASTQTRGRALRATGRARRPRRRLRRRAHEEKQSYIRPCLAQTRMSYPRAGTSGDDVPARGAQSTSCRIPVGSSRMAHIETELITAPTMEVGIPTVHAEASSEYYPSKASFARMHAEAHFLTTYSELSPGFTSQRPS